jgi:N-acetylglutamate synthase-like GNAT family acetyltransferase
MKIERLGLESVGEIAAHLNDVWGSSYGSMTSPVFDPEYLTWLYSAPRTAILGVREGGRLVGIKALLGRTLTIQGHKTDAYLSTHLAIAPSVPMATRLSILGLLSEPQPFTAAHCERAAASFAFYEAPKTLVRNTEEIITRYGLHRSLATFAQSILNPAALLRLDARLPSVRCATFDDTARIAELFRECAPAECLVRECPSAEDVQRHWFTAPEASCYVSQTDGVTTGAMCVYRLRTTKPGTTSTVAVVDYLLASAPFDAAALLKEAIAYAQRIGARGVVVENTTYLDPSIFPLTGLLTTTRRMVLAMIGREPVPIGSAWLLDVK